ncbi:MAG: hypothetical protein JKY93_07895 [Gammaproteobacteria bacterium]|nr:hypothetical protein [Gammaproteobacteria bacterium]
MTSTMNGFTAAMAKVDAMTLRERVMVFFVVLVLLAVLWDQLYLADAMQEDKSLATEVVSMQLNSRTLSTQLDVLTIRAKQDPNKQRKAEIVLLQKQLQTVDLELREKTAELIDPTEMVAVLEKMLASEPGLILISTATTGSSSALEYLKAGEKSDREDSEDGAELDSDAAPKIYKHGLEMHFEGDYYSVVRYIKKLEDMEWQFIWDVVELKTAKYPKVIAKLHLYTLSLSEGWIGV